MGQLVLEVDLFYKGLRPAIKVSLSVSRVGISAQDRAIKRVSGAVNWKSPNTKELESFAQFASDLVLQNIHNEGQSVVETLKQPQNCPCSLAQEVVSLYAVTLGYLDDLPVKKVQAFLSFFMGTIKLKLHANGLKKEKTTQFSQKCSVAVTYIQQGNVCVGYIVR